MKTSLGLEENVEAALAYLLGFVSGILLLLIERQSTFVRFHAAQSVVAFLGLFLIWKILPLIPPFGGVAAVVIPFVSFVVWIYCIVRAYRHEYFKLPIAGDVAENFISRTF
ncbi:MAG: hypothetical protein ABWW66_04770 [Archaeoglobaceae archaeon]